MLCCCCLQDTLLGCKLVTQRDSFITKEVMMNILMNIQVSYWSCSQHCWPSSAAFGVIQKPHVVALVLGPASRCCAVAAAAVAFTEPVLLSVVNRSGMALSLRQPS